MFVRHHRRKTRRNRKRLGRLRKLAFKKQNGKCFWCGEPMIEKAQENACWAHNHPRVCTGDHLILHSAGGGETPENIVAACLECNTKRHWNYVAGGANPQEPYVSPKLGDLFPKPVDAEPSSA